MVKGVCDLKKSPSNLSHEPGHVKRRNIGSSGSRNNNLVGLNHFDMSCLSFSTQNVEP
jgi:hypothetical protein